MLALLIALLVIFLILALCRKKHKASPQGPKLMETDENINPDPGKENSGEGSA